MARRKEAEENNEQPAWLVTFSDLMTLLLTFFVLLLSMAVIDERHKRVALGSVSTAFGVRSAMFNPMSPEKLTRKISGGAMDEGDLAPIRDMLMEDIGKDINFQENKFVQILSINANVLFKPGKPELSEEGMAALSSFIPYLLNIRYPLLVAGHTAPRRDEEGDYYEVSLDNRAVDSTWGLSLARATAVYRFLVESGVPAARLNMEGFGQFRPMFSNNTPESRLRNRRVDLVLDKRNPPDSMGMKGNNAPKPPSSYQFRDFRFELDQPAGKTPQRTP